MFADRMLVSKSYISQLKVDNLDKCLDPRTIVSAVNSQDADTPSLFGFGVWISLDKAGSSFSSQLHPHPPAVCHGSVTFCRPGLRSVTAEQVKGDGLLGRSEKERRSMTALRSVVELLQKKHEGIRISFGAKQSQRSDPGSVPSDRAHVYIHLSGQDRPLPASELIQLRSAKSVLQVLGKTILNSVLSCRRRVSNGGVDTQLANQTLTRLTTELSARRPGIPAVLAGLAGWDL